VQKYEIRRHPHLGEPAVRDRRRRCRWRPGYFFDGFAGGKSHVESDIGRGPDQREIMSLIRAITASATPGLQAEILRLIGRLGQRAAEPAPG